MKKFNFTHTIVVEQNDGKFKEIEVMAVDSEDGGQVLYTRDEWEAGAQADWERDGDGSVTFQGNVPNARIYWIEARVIGWRCVDDRYCPSGDVFDTVADFEEMVDCVFGEDAPSLRMHGRTAAIDSDDRVVLRAVTTDD